MCVGWPGARHVLPGLLLCAAAIAAAGTTATASSDDPAGISVFALDILLTVAPDVPATTRAALTREAARIWAREGVRLRWPAPDAPDDSGGLRLRVLVLARETAAGTPRDGGWAVGELVPSPAQGAVAFASVTGARRVLDEARRSREPRALVEHRMGVVLGRAVAHEIGHYLLDTRTHARTGLMRTGIDAREFSDLRNGSFDLDRDARLWVRHSLAAVRLAAGGGFTYPAQ